MTEQEQLDAWPREPLTESDRKYLRTGIAVGYFVLGFFMLISIVIVYFIISMFFINMVITILLLGAMAVGAYFEFKVLNKVMLDPMRKDKKESEKIVFTGYLTDIGETDRSKLDSMSKSEESDHDYFIEINNVVNIMCNHDNFVRFQYYKDKQVHGAITPESKFLLYLKKL